MAYYIKSKNNFDVDVYSTEDLRWTDNFSQRKLFPTLFQAEQAINGSHSVATGLNGMNYKTAKWRKAIIVDNDIPIVEPESVVEPEPENKDIKSWPIGDQ